MIKALINKIIGDPNARLLKKITPLVSEINKHYEEYKKTLTSDEDFPKKTEEFRERFRKDETLDQLLPEAFGLVKAACDRLLGRKWDVRGHDITWDMVPFDVQLLGAIVLHQGNISEMKTGEGKTLVCTMPLYLNALSGKGCHLVTVNEYLAHRDSEWMGGVYRFLGLTVGVNLHEMSHDAKRAAYNTDIVYGTNSEFGFDYLRDNMAISAKHLVQRDLNYAIVDEVDSILIDEARTPLIISSPAEESTSKYVKYSKLIPQLKENEDYNIDEKMKTAALTEVGIAKLENWLGVENIYTDAGFQEVHHIEQALKAQTVFKLDVDYVVKDGEIIIVDEFTGRLMPGRRYSEGLHQAIEAKEGVEVRRESKTLATISLQNYFRLYDKLAGMTGTALTEAEEFATIYGLDTFAIPTNKTVVRADRSDSVYKNQKGKYKAIAEKIKELYHKGQPVLAGTISVEISEMLSKMLQMQGVPHQVLNAKHHEREAEIIAKAGQKGAVTIATNMAGRGTDIKLGEGVKELGGLFVLGTERHESRRIDNQLRGRSGRQGDPGESQFYVSMEDELMRLFGGERMKRIMEVLKVPDDMPIENGAISKSIESAQKKVEGHNFDIRKHLVEYDDVANKHREIIYNRRKKLLKSEDIKNDVLEMIEKESEGIVLNYTGSRDKGEWDYKELFETVSAVHKDSAEPLSREDLEKITDQEDLIKRVQDYLISSYQKREKALPDAGVLRQIEREVMLSTIDALWMDHIEDLKNLREGVSLRGYAQRDPLMEYKNEAFQMFSKLLAAIQANAVRTLYKVDIEAIASVSLLKKAEEQAKKMMTNEEAIERTITGGTEKADNPVVIKATQVTSKPNVGRNDPCPCGSGKKYKKCCGT